MKKVFFTVTAIAVIMMTFMYGCKKDEFTEEDALQQQSSLDSLKKAGGIVNYTIKVISASNASFAKSGNDDEIDKILVSVTQNGITVSKKTSKGRVSFPNMRSGTALVSISDTSYTNADVIVDLNVPNPGNVDMSDHITDASTIIPVFSLLEKNMSTIQGVVTLEKDLLNNSPETVKDIEITGVIDVDNSTFKDRFLKKPNLLGNIVKIAYSSIVSKTKTDTSGAYILKVPTAAAGLPIKVMVSEFATEQRLLLNSKWGDLVYGEQHIRTIFSSSLDGVTQSPSTLPRVAAAYVTFDAPTGASNLEPTVHAVVEALISNSGIETVVVNNGGNGYTEAPKVVVQGNGQGAEVSATVTNGVITGLNINNPGTGYSGASNVVFLKHGDPGAGTKATASLKMGYSVTSYTITNGGSGYVNAPTVTITGSGSGAQAQAVISGTVNAVALTNPGANYTATPQVIFNSTNGGQGATASVNMTTANPIREIAVNSSPTYSKSTPPTNLVITGSGNSAAATFTMETSGVISYNVIISDSGSGYLSAPIVTITGDGFGATATASIDAQGRVDNINITNQGQGYSNATISIAAPVSGTTATATADIRVHVASITVTDGGSAYLSGNTNVTIDGLLIGTSITYNKSIQSIILANGGSGYIGVPTISIVSIDGNGSGATATATISNQVTGIVVVAQGQNYETAPTVAISAPPIGGTLAQATASVGNGTVKSVTVIDGGTDYTASPNVVLSGGSATMPASITANISNGAVSSFTINNAGIGYSSTPTIEIKTFLGQASASATAYPNAGEVIGVNIINPGAGYVVAPYVEFEVINNGLGSGATATAAIDASGRISSINITNGGTGYDVAPIVKLVLTNGNLTAEGVANITDDGFITGISITNDGEGYINVPNITITPSVNGKGSGAQGVAIIQNGKVIGVSMSNQGSGYTGQNAYTPFGSGADVAGKAFSLYSPTGKIDNSFDVEASKNYIVDINLGTGLRTIDNK